MACLPCQCELAAFAAVTLSPGRKQHSIALLQSLGRIGQCYQNSGGWEEAVRVVASKMLVSNSMIEMESSSGSSALVTVVPKCFVMDTVRMDFDSIAGN